ncbi:hypothetical protein E5720_06800 [Rhodococcus sp. PAMC28707]|uniref:hypothetical protein n=1 Tax=unclassified Rhodococcus (in: high G+C Gram-positive bacteria) TaxID=192944 RepID=UPI00109E23E6|nr:MULTISPECIES: hypothetical protein [unclassified Rhodococcus (in: high G+C Gram-positive bacteria)]QCB50048.1 hypothetical protein E5769_07215 [Rhodococcus sp. PAMC28705]QCB58257.1 hypothetical protein E5720_06800 [Rhodococcus sp. PAMC28707]
MRTRYRHAEHSASGAPGAMTVVGVHESSQRARQTDGSIRGWVAMEEYAAIIENLTSLRVTRLPLADCTETDIVDRLCAVDANVGIALVVGSNAAHSEAIARRVDVRGGPTVVTEIDLATAAMAASVVSTLGQRGISPSRGRVIIACPERAPLLGPALIECGVGSVTSWSNHDAQDFSLRRLISHNDVLVDLSDAENRIGDEMERTITIDSDPVPAASLALPGLFDALSRRAPTRVDASVLVACARALAVLSPRGKLLPDLDQPLLTTTVARYAGRALDLVERLQYSR